MKNRYKFLVIVVLLIGFNSMGQELFPKSWEGNYKGELHIYGVDSVRMKLTMRLAIAQKTDSIFQWKMVYDFKGKEDVRDYEVHIKDIKKGHYTMDEKNSILIDGFYRTGIFTSFFQVMDSFIISTYTKNEDDIIFEIISASGKSPLISGNQKFEESDIPEVKSFLVNGRQKCILKRNN